MVKDDLERPRKRFFRKWCAAAVLKDNRFAGYSPSLQPKKEQRIIWQAMVHSTGLGLRTLLANLC